ncbi:UDP-N-acetylmuramoyl-tripeptide--D-alanyl-D-alanine ligase [Flavobacteriales bacterium]|jgi:UDP-N-acetylmuramoyl-tripeptide--D-alanyl-D-alanine ligase|nr:UDP-N-acetylmuramoyl-tripeptide--D-alanyl-D-alanine ligase [Flavobacteriales bacterium]
MKIKEIYALFQQHSTICTDSRKITNGAMFISLRGENFNGNKYALKAIQDGCSYAIVDEKEFDIHQNTILVNNALKTLQDLATYHRNQLNIPLIGITGSNGKTTSKELINAILNSELSCYATKGNLNNHIGVPLSVLEINKNHKIAIIEMGANHQKEIEFLCNIAQPTFGVITNIGSAHLEGFGSLQGVIDTKKELYEFINYNKGHLFVNAGDELLLSLSKGISQITYGKSGDVFGLITDITPLLSIKYNNEIINSHLIGDFQFSNILLAICIGNYFKVSNQNIKRSIENYIPTNNRSQLVKTKKNTLILDAYNANPSSMKAMLNSFANQEYKNKLCILGDMLELGEESNKEHLEIITLTNELELDCIFVGKIFYSLTKNSFKNKQELVKYIQVNNIHKRTILLKGSRGIGLEQLIKNL